MFYIVVRELDNNIYVAIILTIEHNLKMTHLFTLRIQH